MVNIMYHVTDANPRHEKHDLRDYIILFKRQKISPKYLILMKFISNKKNNIMVAMTRWSGIFISKYFLFYSNSLFAIIVIIIIIYSIYKALYI